MDEILSPFYIFQIASVFLWMADEYYWYAGSILGITIFSVVMEIIETRSNILKVKAMSAFECSINTLRYQDSNDIKDNEVAESDFINISKF